MVALLDAGAQGCKTGDTAYAEIGASHRSEKQLTLVSTAAGRYTGLEAWAQVSTSTAGDDPSVIEPAAVFQQSARSSERAAITRSMLTGVAAIDVLTPMGCGQSMLFVGGPHKRWNLAQLVAQFAPLQQPAFVCYANLGELHEPALTPSCAWLRPAQGASKSHSLLVTMAALSIGEVHMRAGEDALVVIDDLTPIRDVWLASSRLIAQHYANDGFGGDDAGESREFYAALTEHAASLAVGGSLTIIMAAPAGFSATTGEHHGDEQRAYTHADYSPAERTTANRVAILCNRGVRVTRSVLDKLKLQPPGGLRASAEAGAHVEMLKSLMDGHVTIDGAEAEIGTSPPISLAKSLTRIGTGSCRWLRSNPQAPALRGLVEGLRLALSSASDSANASDNPEEAQRFARVWREALKQDPGRPRILSMQVVRALAALNGYALLGSASLDALEQVVHQGDTAAVMERVDATRALTNVDREALEHRIAAFYRSQTSAINSS
jgi:hypothetical protein